MVFYLRFSEFVSFTLVGDFWFVSLRSADLVGAPVYGVEAILGSSECGPISVEGGHAGFFKIPLVMLDVCLSEASFVEEKNNVQEVFDGMPHREKDFVVRPLKIRMVWSAIKGFGPGFLIPILIGVSDEILKSGIHLPFSKVKSMLLVYVKFLAGKWLFRYFSRLVKKRKILSVWFSIVMLLPLYLKQRVEVFLTKYLAVLLHVWNSLYWMVDTNLLAVFDDDFIANVLSSSIIGACKLEAIFKHNLFVPRRNLVSFLKEFDSSTRRGYVNYAELDGTTIGPVRSTVSSNMMVATTTEAARFFSSWSVIRRLGILRFVMFDLAKLDWSYLLDNCGMTGVALHSDCHSSYIFNVLSYDGNLVEEWNINLVVLWVTDRRHVTCSFFMILDSILYELGLLDQNVYSSVANCSVTGVVLQSVYHSGYIVCSAGYVLKESASSEVRDYSSSVVIENVVDLNDAVGWLFGFGHLGSIMRNTSEMNGMPMYFGHDAAGGCEAAGGHYMGCELCLGIFNQLGAGSPSNKKLTGEVLFWRPALMLRREVTLNEMKLLKWVCHGRLWKKFTQLHSLVLELGPIRLLEAPD